MKIAIAEFEHRVYIWDLKTNRELSRFDSILDFGGRRLAISPDGRLCAVGAYHVQGIAAYDTATGEPVWRRKDLKKVQHLGFTLPGDRLLACFARGPAHVLKLDDGTSTETLRGVTDIMESPFAGFQLREHETKCEIFDTARQRRVGAWIPHSFHAAVFTSRSIVVDCTERTGSYMESFPMIEIQMHGAISYSLEDGAALWKSMLPKGVNFQTLGFCEKTGQLVGVTWPYLRGGEKKLVSLENESGKTIQETLIDGCPAEAEFARRGSLLLTSNGDLIDVPSAERMRTLEFTTPMRGELE